MIQNREQVLTEYLQDSARTLFSTDSDSTQVNNEVIIEGPLPTDYSEFSFKPSSKRLAVKKPHFNPPPLPIPEDKENMEYNTLHTSSSKGLKKMKPFF